MVTFLDEDKVVRKEIKYDIYSTPELGGAQTIQTVQDICLSSTAINSRVFSKEIGLEEIDIWTANNTPPPCASLSLQYITKSVVKI